MLFDFFRPITSTFTTINGIIEKGEKHFFHLIDVYVKIIMVVIFSCSIYKGIYNDYTLIPFNLHSIIAYFQSVEFKRTLFILFLASLMFYWVFPMLIKYVYFELSYVCILSLKKGIGTFLEKRRLNFQKHSIGIYLMKLFYLNNNKLTRNAVVIEDIVKSFFEDVKGGYSKTVVSITLKLAITVFVYVEIFDHSLLLPNWLENILVFCICYYLFNLTILYWIQKYLLAHGHETIRWMNKAKNAAMALDDQPNLIDKPIQLRRHDKLSGRKSFAKSIGRIIKDHQSKSPLVIGISGEWGHGKTSALNLLLERIKYSDHDRGYEVFEFKPILVLNSEKLIESFLSEYYLFLISSFGQETTKLVDAPLKRYLDFFVRDKNSKNLEELIKVKAYDNTITETKREIEFALKNIDSRIIVILDEIDRLTKDEVLATLKMVKTIVDFPNTIFIIPYDKTRIAKILEEDSIDMLKKVINLEVSLPPILENDLYSILTTGFQIHILNKNTEEIEKTQERWDGIFNEVLKHYIKSIRDVNNYLFSLKALWGSIKPELDKLDFAALTCLQYFDLELYLFIGNNKHAFTACKSNGHVPFHDHEKRIKEVLESYPKYSILKDNVKALNSVIYTIFPNLRTWRSDPYYGEIDIDIHTWKGLNRICISSEFSRYFFQDFEVNPLSNGELVQIGNVELSEDILKKNMDEIFSKKESKYFFLDRIFSYLKENYSQDEGLLLLERLIPNYVQALENRIGVIDGTPYLIKKLILELLSRMKSHKIAILGKLLKSEQIHLAHYLTFLSQVYKLENHDDQLSLDSAAYDLQFRKSPEFAVHRNAIVSHLAELNETVFTKLHFISLIDWYKTLTDNSDPKYLLMLEVYIEYSVENTVHYLKEMISIMWLNRNGKTYRRSVYNLERMNDVYSNEKLHKRITENSFMKSVNSSNRNYVELFLNFYNGNEDLESTRTEWIFKPYYNENMQLIKGEIKD